MAIGLSGDHRTGGQAGGGQGWSGDSCGCRARPRMESEPEFGGSALAFDSAVVIRGQTGRGPELDWLCFQFSDLPLHSTWSSESDA